eukprot:TRINITY_DN5774_c0_g1_i2.p1 TRINITY_DN5774_c0_g1~~TRINITY_DN5774_c0_g1_i2.p1  ORF type:complete len:130 (+),score=5.77 TRINITY_DN5774_c0_g1_i2:125-514(+)
MTSTTEGDLQNITQGLTGMVYIRKGMIFPRWKPMCYEINKKGTLQVKRVGKQDIEICVSRCELLSIDEHDSKPIWIIYTTKKHKKIFCFKSMNIAEMKCCISKLRYTGEKKCKNNSPENSSNILPAHAL